MDFDIAKYSGTDLKKWTYGVGDLKVSNILGVANYDSKTAEGQEKRDKLTRNILNAAAEVAVNHHVPGDKAATKEARRDQLKQNAKELGLTQAWVDHYAKLFDYFAKQEGIVFADLHTKPKVFDQAKLDRAYDDLANSTAAPDSAEFNSLKNRIATLENEKAGVIEANIELENKQVALRRKISNGVGVHASWELDSSWEKKLSPESKFKAKTSNEAKKWQHSDNALWDWEARKHVKEKQIGIGARVEAIIAANQDWRVWQNEEADKKRRENFKKAVDGQPME